MAGPAPDEAVRAWRAAGLPDSAGFDTYYEKYLQPGGLSREQAMEGFLDRGLTLSVSVERPPTPQLPEGPARPALQAVKQGVSLSRPPMQMTLPTMSQGGLPPPQVLSAAPEGQPIVPMSTGEKIASLPARFLGGVGGMAVGLSSLAARGVMEGARTFKAAAGLPEDLLTQPFEKTPFAQKTVMGQLLTQDQARQEAKDAGKNMIQSQIASVKKSFGQPVTALLDDPFSTVLDWSLLTSLGGSALEQGIKTMGKVGVLEAKTAERLLSTERATRQIGQIAVTRAYSQNPLIKAAQASMDVLQETPVGKAVLESLSKVPGAGNMVPMAYAADDVALGRVARREAHMARLIASDNMAKAGQDVHELFAGLSADDLQAFIPLVEGREMHPNASVALKTAVERYQGMVKEERSLMWPDEPTFNAELNKFRLQMAGQKIEKGLAPELSDASLQAEKIKRVVWQPVLFGEGNLRMTEPRVVKGERIYRDLSPQEIYRKADGLGPTADRARAVIDKAIGVAEPAWKEKWVTAMMDEQDIPRADVERMWEVVKPGPDYFPHIIERKLAERAGVTMKPDEVLGVEGAKLMKPGAGRLPKNYTPGAMKSRFGDQAFITDPQRALAYHRYDVTQFLNNQMILDRMQKYAEPFKKGDVLKEGNVVFAPDGYAKLFRQQLNIQSEAAKIAQSRVLKLSVDDTFDHALKAALPENVALRDVMRLRIPPLFQMPKTVADGFKAELHTHLDPAPLTVFNNVLDAWRVSVLGLSPRWIANNTMGNVFFTTLAGVGPNDFRVGRAMAKEGIIPREVALGGFRRSEAALSSMMKEPVAPPLAAARRIGEVMRKGLATPFQLNGAIEDLFRNATYASGAMRLARKQAFSEAGQGFLKVRGMWDRLKGTGDFSEETLINRVKNFSPEAQQGLVDHVNQFMLNYGNLTPFERTTMRAIFPFWTWYREITKYGASLPVLFPGRTTLLKQLAQVGTEAERQELKSQDIDVNMLDQWQRGGTMIRQDADTLTRLVPQKAMVLGNVGTFGTGLNPALKVITERMTGRKTFPAGEPFRHPDVVFKRGKFWAEGPDGALVNLGEEGAPMPGLLTHIARQFPQVVLMERVAQALRGHPGWDALGLFSDVPRPVRTGDNEETRDREIKKTENALVRFLGIPIQEVDRSLYLLEQKQRGPLLRDLRRQKARTQNIMQGQP